VDPVAGNSLMATGFGEVVGTRVAAVGSGVISAIEAACAIGAYANWRDMTTRKIILSMILSWYESTRVMSNTFNCFYQDYSEIMKTELSSPQKWRLGFVRHTCIFVGVCTLVFLLWEPHTEGVNANTNSLQAIYFDDPFLLAVYSGAIPFFIALLHLPHIYESVSLNHREKTLLHLRSVRACAMASTLSIIGIMSLIFSNSDGDDYAGALSVCLVLLFVSGVVTLGTNKYIHMV
jgi:hypothetical protein